MNQLSKMVEGMQREEETRTIKICRIHPSGNQNIGIAGKSAIPSGPK
jgi:hypothetical protein